jgi:leucyl aminopeptidase
MSGKTVECINTDAEGRLVLADAITYAQQKEGAKYIVDLATLTGACVVALGHTVTGVMGAPQEFVELVIKNARAEGEKAWQLPMYEEHSEQLKSTLADIKNVGGRSAGAITGACFLKEFVQNGTSWAHLDIAGTAELEDDKPYMPKGPTGVGVRTLVRLAKSMQLQREGEHST